MRPCKIKHLSNAFVVYVGAETEQVEIFKLFEIRDRIDKFGFAIKYVDIMQLIQKPH